MNRRTHGFIVLLFGGALVRLAVSDALLRYVKPSARPWVLLAGVALVAVAVGELVLEHRGQRRPGDDDGSSASGDGDHGRAPRSGWLVLAPVVAILVIAPPALGSFTASRASTPVTAQPGTRKDFPALTGPSPHGLSLFDFTTRVVWDGGRTLHGQDVALTGFVLAQHPDGFVLARLVITCCAADARPVEVLVRSSSHPTTDGWVTVTGQYAGTDPAQPTFPILDSSGVTHAAEPANPYD
jgi:uncharacterized repeat protein (TIGR03943 family)